MNTVGLRQEKWWEKSNPVLFNVEKLKWKMFWDASTSLTGTVWCCVCAFITLQNVSQFHRVRLLLFGVMLPGLLSGLYQPPFYEGCISRNKLQAAHFRFAGEVRLKSLTQQHFKRWFGDTRPLSLLIRDNLHDFLGTWLIALLGGESSIFLMACFSLWRWKHSSEEDKGKRVKWEAEGRKTEGKGQRAKWRELKSFRSNKEARRDLVGNTKQEIIQREEVRDSKET